MKGPSHSVHLRPFSGESASGFLVRLSRFLSLEVGTPLYILLGDSRAVASAVHMPSLAQAVAELAGVSHQELLPLFALPDKRTNYLRIGSFILRATQIDQSVRRIAPSVLASDIRAGRRPYHRLIWSIAALRFDPETSDELIQTCDRCGRDLRWVDAFDVAQCSVCTRRLWLSSSTKASDPYDRFVGGLFNPAINVRSATRSKLPSKTRAWAEGDILDLIDVVGEFNLSMNHDLASGPRSKEITGVATVLAGEAAIRTSLRRPLQQAMKDNNRLAPVLASCATAARVRRGPSRRVSDYLMTLVI